MKYSINILDQIRKSDRIGDATIRYCTIRDLISPDCVWDIDS